MVWQKKKTYYLDIADEFWIKNAGVQFPEVAESVDVELNKYKEEYEKVSKMAGGAEDPSAQFDPSSTDSLKSVVSTLPMMTEKKRVLDMHMNLATNLLRQIKERQIDFFVSIEEAFNKQTKASLLEILRDQQKGLPEDKLRLFLVYYLSTDELSDADLKEYEDALKAGGCSANSLAYLKQVKAVGKLSGLSQFGHDGGVRGDSILGMGLKSLGSKWTDGMVDNAVAMLKSGVKNLRSILPSDQALPVTRIVDSIMEAKVNAEIDQYLYFDPKSPSGSDGRSMPKTRATFHSGIVFVVGGGNYNEYQNLQEYSQKLIQPKEITYGATDLLTAKQFLAQLEDLGSNS